MYEILFVPFFKTCRINQCSVFCYCVQSVELFVRDFAHSVPVDIVVIIVCVNYGLWQAASFNIVC